MGTERPADGRDPSERNELRSFFIKWHFFAPFFAGVLGLLVAFVFLFLTSTSYLFDFYKDRQAGEAMAAVRDAVAKRQEYLRSYLAFIRDDADFKNAFYYAGEDMISLKKPLADYLRKYKPLLGWDFIEAVAPDGRVIHSEAPAAHGRRARLGEELRPTDEIATELVMIDQTPHLAAAIPVRLFNKPVGHLVVGFDFGPSLLKELHEVTRHDFFLLDAAGRMAVSTMEDQGLRQTLLAALAARRPLPIEVAREGRRYLLSELPIQNPGAKAESAMDLYVVRDTSELAAFRRRIILNAVMLFAFIGAAGFLISFFSSRALSRKVNKLLGEMQEYRIKIEGQKKLAALVELAGQISHDIRSPLAALDSVTGSVAHLPEDQRLMIRSAVGRIRDIANQLLGTAAPAPGAASPSKAAPEAPQARGAHGYLLSSLIDPIITEKRLEFRSRLGVEIDARLDVASYGHFAEVEPAEFKRVLSNLISNGVEALPGRGIVTVSLLRADGMIELRLEDDGKGIPSEVLERLGRRGETYGKAGGSGLGLYYAKTTAEAWGGSLDIASEVGKGTTVTVRLPAAPAPAWFVSRLELVPNSPVVILDDDPTIHQIWQGRFDPSREAGVEVVHCSRADELRRWVAADPRKAAEAIYLLDYELRGDEQTGLALAKDLNLGDRSVLVTSRFEDKPILDECVRLGIRLIPKGLAGFVPISCTRHLQPDAILIDDDHLVHANWRVAARTSGKTLDAFSTPSAFLAIVGRVDKETPIYVDSILTNGVRGEDFAKDLHAKGFRNLYLATGHQPATLPALPWIKEIVGKKAPWT